MPVIAKTFRINYEVAKMLEEEAVEKGISQTRIIEAAIRLYCKSAVQEQSEEGEDASGVIAQSEAVATLREQIDYLQGQVEKKDRQIDKKDEQIASLSGELSTALSRAQTMQAMAMKRPPLPQRIRAWLGSAKK